MTTVFNVSNWSVPERHLYLPSLLDLPFYPCRLTIHCRFIRTRTIFSSSVRSSGSISYCSSRSATCSQCVASSTSSSSVRCLVEFSAEFWFFCEVPTGCRMWDAVGCLQGGRVLSRLIHMPVCRLPW